MTAVVPIWRRPWMVLGPDTFAGDVLARLGVANVYADATDSATRGRRWTRSAAVGADLVVLPDEPYAFTADDGPEAFAGMPAARSSAAGTSPGTARRWWRRPHCSPPSLG